MFFACFPASHLQVGFYRRLLPCPPSEYGEAKGFSLDCLKNAIAAAFAPTSREAVFCDSHLISESGVCSLHLNCLICDLFFLLKKNAAGSLKLWPWYHLSREVFFSPLFDLWHRGRSCNGALSRERCKKTNENDTRGQIFGTEKNVQKRQCLECLDLRSPSRAAGATQKHVKTLTQREL